MGRAQALVLCLALASSPAGAAPDAAAAALPGPVLTVGVEPGAGPRAAFARDLFGTVAQIMDVGIAWVEVARDDAASGLALGRYGVASFVVAFSRTSGFAALPPVALAGDVILKRRGDGGLQEPADVAGKAVGLIGPAAEAAGLRELVTSMRARLPRRTSLADPVADLAAGRLAALAGPLDAVAAARLARPDLFDVVGPPFGPTAWLIPAARPGPLADRISAALGRMRADGSLAALQQRWFGLVFDPPDALRAGRASAPLGR